MRGRSAEQLAAYEDRLAAVASILAGAPATAEEVVVALAGGPAACGVVSVYGRIRAIEARGYRVRRRKRRGRAEGKTGSREREFWIDLEEVR